MYVAQALAHAQELVYCLTTEKPAFSSSQLPAKLSSILLCCIVAVLLLAILVYSCNKQASKAIAMLLSRRGWACLEARSILANALPAFPSYYIVYTTQQLSLLGTLLLCGELGGSRGERSKARLG